MADRRLSANAERARRLLVAGAVGGHATAVVAVPLTFALAGPRPGWTSLVTALAVLAFFGIGQTVQLVLADRDPQLLLVASLISYAVRVGGLALLLVFAQRNAQRWDADPRAVAITAVAVVLGWLTAEVITFQRLRIPAFDSPEDSSDSQS